MNTDINIRKLEERDVMNVSEMEVTAWHEYYSQYPTLYSAIKDSVTVEAVSNDWYKFLAADQSYAGKMVTGQDRAAFIAFVSGEAVGIGAASAYKNGVAVWQPADEFFGCDDGVLPKIAKFQNLYIAAKHRGNQIGCRLNIARAEYMLDKGYAGIFLTPYADATKTLEYHSKNGLKHIHNYQSLSTYKDGQHVTIACFANASLQNMYKYWQEQLQTKEN